MQRLADRLGIAVPADLWQVLVRAAGFDQMRRRAAHLAPDFVGILRDPAAFRRRGTSGDGVEVLTPAQLERYSRRATTLAPPDLLSWLHR